MNAKVLSKLETLAEELEWHVFTSDAIKGLSFELESYSPLGENIFIGFSASSPHDIVEEAIENYLNFDAEEHVSMWYGANRGEPKSLRLLLKDADEIDRMYYELARELLYLFGSDKQKDVYYYTFWKTPEEYEAGV